MPIFEYNCPICGKIEALVMPGETELTLCPECQAKGKESKITKAISASALSFKGSGFYITDYTSKSSSAGDSKTSSEGKAKVDAPAEKPAAAPDKKAPIAAPKD